MSPRGQDGYSQVPSPPDIARIDAESSRLLDPANSDSNSNNEHGNEISQKGKKGITGNRHAVICLFFCVLTLVVLLLGILSDRSPLHYLSHLFRSDSSSGTFCVERDAVMKLKQMSTRKCYMAPSRPRIETLSSHYRAPFHSGRIEARSRRIRPSSLF